MCTSSRLCAVNWMALCGCCYEEMHSNYKHCILIERFIKSAVEPAYSSSGWPTHIILRTRKHEQYSRDEPEMGSGKKCEIDSTYLLQRLPYTTVSHSVKFSFNFFLSILQLFIWWSRSSVNFHVSPCKPPWPNSFACHSSCSLCLWRVCASIFIISWAAENEIKSFYPEDWETHAHEWHVFVRIFARP